MDETDVDGGPLIRDVLHYTTLHKDFRYFEQSGRNESKFVGVSKLTNDIPFLFPGLKYDLKITDLGTLNSLADLPLEVGDFLKSNRRKTLEQLYEVASNTMVSPHDYQRSNCPLLLQVVAKKKSDVVIHRGTKSLVYSSMYVCDEKLYCKLLTVNDGTQSIYDCVEVGDHMLLTQYTYHFVDSIHESDVVLPEDGFTNLEIKLTQFQARNTYRFIFSSTNPLSKLPSFLFPSKSIWTPRNLLRLNPGNNIPSEGANKENFKQSRGFTIIGIVNYVGQVRRMERRRFTIYCGELAETRPFLHSVRPNIHFSETLKSEECVQYTASRWIELVDPLSDESLPILLYIRKENWYLQSKIVPGASILLTHCIGPSDHVMFPLHYRTSVYSSLYVGTDVKKYLSLCPTRDQVLADLLCFKKESYETAIKRTDVPWCIGRDFDIHLNPNENSIRYFDYFKEKLIVRSMAFKTKTEPKRPSFYVFNEYEKIQFIGKIDKLWVIEEGKTIPPGLNEYEPERMQDYVKFHNFFSKGEFSSKPIIGFSREKNLPVDISEFPNADPLEITDMLAKKHSNISKALCLPHSVDEDPSAQALEDMEVRKYFIVDILSTPIWPKVGIRLDTTYSFNEFRYEDPIWYRCVCIPNRQSSVAAMESKLKAVQNKLALCAVNVSCPDKECKNLQVKLVDFVGISNDQFDDLVNSLKEAYVTR